MISLFDKQPFGTIILLLAPVLYCIPDFKTLLRLPEHEVNEAYLRLYPQLQKL
jgi:hypothetical protein